MTHFPSEFNEIFFLPSSYITYTPVALHKRCVCNTKVIRNIFRKILVFLDSTLKYFCEKIYFTSNIGNHQSEQSHLQRNCCFLHCTLHNRSIKSGRYVQCRKLLFLFLLTLVWSKHCIQRTQYTQCTYVHNLLKITLQKKSK